MASLMSARSIEFPDSAALDTRTEYQRTQHLSSRHQRIFQRGACPRDQVESGEHLA